MKKLLILLAFCFSILLQRAWAQGIINLNELSPPVDYENIWVQKLTSDSNSTSFVIWIKKNVKPHFHQNHTETLYVVSGTATMMLSDTLVEIKPGDFFVIPPGTTHSVSVTSKEALKVISVQSPEFLGDDRIFVEDK